MAALALGLVAGGALTGLILWLTGGLLAWLPVTAGPYIVGSVALAIVLRDLDVVSVPLPGRKWQVPRSILDLDPRQAAAGFGFELGLGFRTYVTASAPYLLIATVVALRAPLLVCLACGVAFGLGRFAMPVCRYLSADGGAWNSLMGSRSIVLRRATGVVAGLGAVLLAFVT